MAKQLLDGAQIAATLNEMGRERVAERVGTYPLRQSKRLGMTTDDQKDAAPRDAAAAVVDDQGIHILPRAEVCPTASQVTLDCTHSLAAARHDALAPTFAEHADEPEFSIKVSGP